MKIFARKHWNPLGFEVRHGETYRLVASGSWKDFTIAATAAGYPTAAAPWYSRPLLSFAERFRRVPTANWFTLICMVGRRTATAFAVSDNPKWTATIDGPLECFANDVGYAYFNNRGSVTLDVTHL